MLAEKRKGRGGGGGVSLSGVCHDLDLDVVHSSDVMKLTFVFRSNHKRRVALETAGSMWAADCAAPCNAQQAHMFATPKNLAEQIGVLRQNVCI